VKTVIILAMHGTPPHDFPRREAAEFFNLHAQLDHSPGVRRADVERRYAELDAKMRAWPRTPQNDPFHTGSYKLAEHLSRTTGCEVIVGFNEFCAPSLDEAFDQASARGYGKVIVVTPMMTRGGEHSEVDIPAAIARAHERHPHLAIEYAWPFDMSEVAGFLAAHLTRPA
jgi:sirohydrochlorin cobaltochelatase